MWHHHSSRPDGPRLFTGVGSHYQGRAPPARWSDIRDLSHQCLTITDECTHQHCTTTEKCTHHNSSISHICIKKSQVQHSPITRQQHSYQTSSYSSTMTNAEVSLSKLNLSFNLPRQHVRKLLVIDISPRLPKFTNSLTPVMLASYWNVIDFDNFRIFPQLSHACYCEVIGVVLLNCSHWNYTNYIRIVTIWKKNVVMLYTSLVRYCCVANWLYVRTSISAQTPVGGALGGYLRVASNVFSQKSDE